MVMKKQMGLIEEKGKGNGDLTIKKLENYLATLTDKDILTIARRGKLNRTLVATESGFSKSCWTSNDKLLEMLVKFEKECREKGLLGQLKVKNAPSNGSSTEGEVSKEYNQQQSKELANDRRLKALEKQLLAKDVEIASLKAALKKYQALDELKDVISDLGIMPR